MFAAFVSDMIALILVIPIVQFMSPNVWQWSMNSNYMYAVA